MIFLESAILAADIVLGDNPCVVLSVARFYQLLVKCWLSELG